MSTGIECTGGQRGLGAHCDGHAMPDTRLCQPCIREAKARGVEIRHYTLQEQVAHAWGPRKRRMWHELTEREVEPGG